MSTRIPWLPFIPSDWKIGKVKQFFSISKELSCKNNPTILSLARSYVKIRDISSNEGQLAANYSNYNSVKPGDLLLNPMDLYSGANCNVSNLEGVISPAYSNLRAKTQLDPKFYDFYFKTQYWTMAMFAHGKGVSYDNRWTLNANTLLNYEIPVPSFNEQTKIVDFLNKQTSKIDQLISNQEKQIEKLKEYRQAIIDNAFVHCKKIKLKYVTNGISDGTHGTFVRVNDGKPLLSAKNLGDDQLIISSNESCISKEDYESIIKCGFPKKNDILMCCVGDIGKALIYDRVEVHAFQRSVMFIRPSNKILPKFLLYGLRTSNVRVQETKMANKTIQSGLYQGLMKELFVPYVEGTPQQEEILSSIEHTLKCIEKLSRIKREKISVLKSCKQSLIYEYVTGKKRVSL